MQSLSLAGVVALALAVTMSGCGPVMEARRPDPVDLSQFKPGEQRFDVVKVLGAPTTSVPNGSNSCDIYKLYTHGPSSAGKAAYAFGEGVTDVFTLGLAEVLWTPVEAGTKNSLYTVSFCYDKDSKLVSVQEARPASDVEGDKPAQPGK